MIMKFQFELQSKAIENGIINTIIPNLKNDGKHSKQKTTNVYMTLRE